MDPKPIFDRIFNNVRFDGLHYINASEGLRYINVSNKYLTMQRVSDDKFRIVVKVDGSRLQKIKYGYRFILDRYRNLCLYDWQVSKSIYGNEVLLTRPSFGVIYEGKFDEFETVDESELTFEHWLEIAKEQSYIVEYNGYCFPGEPVFWKK